MNFSLLNYVSVLIICTCVPPTHTCTEQTLLYKEQEKKDGKSKAKAHTI